MSKIFLEIRVQARLAQWSNPKGGAEITLEVEYDDADTLVFGTVLQGAIRSALSELSAALQEEEKDEKAE